MHVLSYTNSQQHDVFGEQCTAAITIATVGARTARPRQTPPRDRIVQHMQFMGYIMSFSSVPQRSQQTPALFDVYSAHSLPLPSTDDDDESTTAGSSGGTLLPITLRPVNRGVQIVKI